MLGMFFSYVRRSPSIIETQYNGLGLKPRDHIRHEGHDKSDLNTCIIISIIIIYVHVTHN